MEEHIYGRQKERISYSHISTFEKCPLMYSYRYIERVPVPPSKYLSFGNSIHAAIEEFQKIYFLSEKPLTDTDSEDLIVELLNKHWKSEGYDSQSEMNQWKQKAIKALHSYFLPWFFFQLEDSYETIAIEDWFEVDFEICSLIGKIDRIDLRKADDAIYYRIIDFKTGENIPAKHSQSEDLQLYVYTYGAENLLKQKLNGSLPDDEFLKIEKIMFYYILPGKEVENSLEEGRRTFARQKIASQAAEIINARKAGDFPARTGNHCRWCDFQNICEAYRKITSPAPVEETPEEKLKRLIEELNLKQAEVKKIEEEIAAVMRNNGITEFAHKNRIIRLKTK